MNKVVSILSIPRTLLGIGATVKGLVAGSIGYIDENGVSVNCLLAEEIIKLIHLAGSFYSALYINYYDQFHNWNQNELREEII